MNLKAIGSLTILLFLTVQLSLGAEEFRGNPKEQITVGPEDKEGIATTLGLGDLLYISREDVYGFLEGVELEIRPPAAAIQEPYSVSVTLYHLRAPFPGTGVALLRGDLLLQEELQPSNRFYYRVPLNTAASFHRQADTRVISTAVALSDERPLAIGFWPRMKGMPTAISRGEFTVTVRPVIGDRGGARLMLLRERTNTPIALDGDASRLLIDGTVVSGEEDIHFLSSGLHRLRVESDRYLPAEATFAVEPGEVTMVRLELQPLTTEVLLSLPEEVAVYVDGNPLDQSAGRAELPLGEHLVVLELGGYTVQRTITLEAGRTYELGLDLDVFLQEN